MTGYSRFERADYILPTGQSMNPLHPEDAEYFDENQVAIVLFKLNDSRTRPTRVVTSYGDAAGWEIGDKYSCYHDQTGAFLGDYEVVGRHFFASGVVEGDVPDRKIKHSVFK